MAKRGAGSGSPPAAEQTSELRPQVGSGVWKTIFGGESLLFCLIEMIKDSNDWDASAIWFWTNERRNQIRWVDNGKGMSSANRRAFLSVNQTTALGHKQSGKYGTGIKYTIFGWCSFTEVLTAPEDDPAHVYRLEFTTDELDEGLSQRGTIRQICLPKTPQTWPHEHEFGIDVRFTLEKPETRSILRGEALARELSRRLDSARIENGSICVDGQPLPFKEIIGRTFKRSIADGADPSLGGRVRVDIYRPKNRPQRGPSGDDLWLGGVSMGEVSFRKSFLGQLSPEQRERIPLVFLMEEVCGLIIFSPLDEYTTESRQAFNSRVAEDERINGFIRFLISIAPEVASYLEIKLREVDETTDPKGQQAIAEVVELAQKRYNPDRETPPGYRGIDGVEGPTEVIEGPIRPPRPPRPPQFPRLEIERGEFAVGEEIKVRLYLDDELANYHLYLDAARAKELRRDGEHVWLEATEVGPGIIRITHKQTMDNAQVEYEVVEQRHFRLSASDLIVEAGASITIRAVNADLLRGKPRWELVPSTQGDISPSPNGLRASFSAHHGASTLEVVAVDDKNPSCFAKCSVIVIPKRPERIPFQLRGQYFVWEFTESDASEFARPVVIPRIDPGRVHRMVFNPMAPGYQEAMAAGTLTDFLIYWMSIEFARVFCLPEMEETILAADVPSIVRDIENEAAKIAAELKSVN